MYCSQTSEHAPMGLYKVELLRDGIKIHTARLYISLSVSEAEELMQAIKDALPYEAVDITTD